MAVLATLVYFVFVGDGARAAPPTFRATFVADRPSLNGTAFARGLNWTVERGSFASFGGTATGAAAGDGPAFATVGLHAPPAVVIVSFAHATGGSGLVFRYRDTKNYWSVVAAPEYGTWNINKTVAGETTFVANTGNNFSADDTSLQIHQIGTVLTLEVDGKPSMRVDDRAFLDQLRVGLLSGVKDQAETRWRSVSVTESPAGAPVD